MPKMAYKNSWTRVAFGDVVRLSRERSSDPERDGLRRYVGLEHIEPGDLSIRRWGDITDGITFTNVFRVGQVLFGKRRAYQRKVAIADFDGVCSGDIYVLESKSEHLLPELLPFICQTDEFFEHAVGTSTGSLSPRTNWNSLASFEFALPPLERQRWIAHALISAQRTMEAYIKLYRQSTISLESASRQVCRKYAQTHIVGDFCTVNPESLSINQINSSEVWDYIDLSSIEFPEGIRTTSPMQPRNAPSRARRIVRTGDILVSTVRPNLRGHAIVGVCRAPLVASTGFAVLRSAQSEYRHLLFALILSDAFLWHCQLHVTGTAYPAVGARDVTNFKVPYLPELVEAGYGQIFQQAIYVLKSTWQRQMELRQAILPCLRNAVLKP